jgi:hypothetical protein
VLAGPADNGPSRPGAAIDLDTTPDRPWRRFDLAVEIPWNRVVAAGASVVSFASMVVAMGPIFATDEATATEAAGSTPDPVDATGAALTAPPVDIRVDPATGSLPADPLAVAVPGGAATPPGGAEDPTVATAPLPSTPDLGSGEQASSAPNPSSTPAGQATASTEGPSTLAPSTRATPPPTTAAPTTAAPTTAAPTTRGSGG